MRGWALAVGLALTTLASVPAISAPAESTPTPLVRASGPDAQMRRLEPFDLPSRQEDARASSTDYVRPQVVIGTDERWRVSPTTSLPARAVAHLEILDAYGRTVFCTGTYIGPNVVVTAAHCLYNPDLGWVYGVRVIPARDGLVQPYGYEFGTHAWVSPGWPVFPTTEWDWGLVRMAPPGLGATVGWLTLAALRTDTLTAPDFWPTINGYPGDKTFGTQWAGSKPSLYSVGAADLRYLIDTYGVRAAPPCGGSRIISWSVSTRPAWRFSAGTKEPASRAA